MTVIGLDDTDSMEGGLCTTYVASRVAAKIEELGETVDRRLLIRCNPAVEHKTRGNAALAIHTDADPGMGMEILEEELQTARTSDPNTNPGGVVAQWDPNAVPTDVATFARDAVQDILEIDSARNIAESADYRTVSVGNGRGIIGALAAVGAWQAFEEWTYECIAYRERSRWGTDRAINHNSVFSAAKKAYPDAWDTVDREEGRAICVPRTPCPILHAIRGDDPEVVTTTSKRIEGEPVAGRTLFVTNQGTDAHLQPADAVAAVEDGRAYWLTAMVTKAPETMAGGHVFFTIKDSTAELECVAFEPTKRFRSRVRALRSGDRLTVCGEVSSGTLKLEKFAVRDRVEITAVTPECPNCGRSMSSAGRGQGYRCRKCKTDAPGKIWQGLDRNIDLGWYEVPPCARRHIAKPLIRGDFDAPIHPEL